MQKMCLTSKHASFVHYQVTCHLSQEITPKDFYDRYYQNLNLKITILLLFIFVVFQTCISFKSGTQKEMQKQVPFYFCCMEEKSNESEFVVRLGF